MKFLYQLNLKYILITLFVIIELILFSFFNYNKSEKENYILNEQNLRLKVQYEAIKNNFKKLALAIFDGILNKKEVIDIFKKAHLATQKQKVDIRRELFELLKDDYENLSKIQIKQLHFHLPNGESFLRFHLPNEYGDNLFDIRYSIQVANLEKRHIDGFEIGRHYSSYRSVFPMFDENSTHIGSIEVSIPFSALMTQMNLSFPTHIHFIIKKNIIDEKIFDNGKEYYKKSDLCNEQINNFVCEKKTFLNKLGVDYSALHLKLDRELIDKLDKLLKYKIEKYIKTNKPFSINQKLNDKYYIASFLPIKDIEERVSAYVISYTESKELFHLTTTFISEISLATIFNLFLILFIYKTLKMMELKRSEEHLKKLSRELEERVKEEVLKNREKDRIMFEQSKYVQMGEMLAMIAHQWRQPLSSISTAMMNITVKNEFGELDSGYLNEQSDFVQNETQKMSTIIDNFINYFKPKGEKEEFKLIEIIKNIKTLMDMELQNQDIEFKYQIDEEITLYTFKNELRQVITNIVLNSKDAFENSQNSNKFISIEAFSEKNKLIILIKDNAIGIKEEILNRIFEPYFSTKEEGKGIGMGLFISKTIIENSMGGKLNVRNLNEKIKGVVFTIELPLNNS